MKTDKVYIVFDGTSYFGIFDCDIDDYINDERCEIVEGVFPEWDNKVDRRIEELNDEIRNN